MIFCRSSRIWVLAISWTSIRVNCLVGNSRECLFARALAKKPEILFLDEPTGALDEETGRKILDYIWKLKEKLGFTLIMVTHNQNIADMARTIIRVNSGKITEVVTNDQPQTAYEIGW